jgi:exodeoxyribonuclease VII large subunit
MHSTDLPQPARTILSVGELNHTARIQLESCFKVVWVEGEISNFSRPSSGHIYFSLKDSLAQVRCAWFKNRQHSRPSAPFKDGMQVVVRARVSLFEGRGEFQLLVEQIEPAGFGPLQQQFEALKLKLNREGLFDPTAKKALPHLPHRIGVISSPTGAAIRDVLSVLQRRCPMIPVMLYPTPVQGEGADIQIIQALERAVTRNECQTLILCRGGGSIEDLWAFNSEALARALYACPIPIISGICCR